MFGRKRPDPAAEEFASFIAHSVGLVLSLIGLPVLVGLAVSRGGTSHVVSCAIFGVTLVLMYATSTLYHGFRAPHIKRIFRVMDHVAIFLLIAGTYTPFTVVILWPNIGKVLLVVVWGLALAGVLFKVFFAGRYHILSTLAYLVVGWIAVVAAKPMMEALPLGGLLWIVAGGLAYTIGVFFYVWKRLPFNHAIWHLFVMAGSACHYVAVMLYVVPHTRS